MVIAKADGFEIEESDFYKGRYNVCVFYKNTLIGYWISWPNNRSKVPA